AGGVAHEYNNLLAVILGYSELLLMRTDPSDPHRVELEQIKKAGERAAAITQQILAFSRKQIVTPRIVDLNSVVTQSTEDLKRTLGESIEVVTKLGAARDNVR